MTKVLLNFALMASASGLMTACQNQLEPTPLETLSQNSVEALNCSQFESKLFDSIYKYSIETDSMPPLNELEQILNLPPRLVAPVVEVFKAIDSSRSPQLDAEDNLVAQLVALELKQGSTEAVDSAIEQLRQALKAEGLAEQNCASEQPSSETEEPIDETPVQSMSTGSKDVLTAIKETSNLPTYGLKKTFLTAYQSCDVATMSALGIEAKPVRGIAIIGKHSSGAGNIRVIDSLSQVQATHPYIQKPHLGQGCFRVDKKPLIYDFGGKPYPYGENGSNDTLNLFRNSGSGSKELGIDCSGFIYSALASAGLKLYSDKELKGIYSHYVNSRALMDPEKSGIDCLKKIAVNGTSPVQTGDIIASSAHVVMISHLGTDPFGLKKITKVSDCTTAKLNAAQFDFSIMQSSPSLNGLGINEMTVSRYLRDENQTMKRGLEAYAVASCKAKFGGPTRFTLSDLSITRHTLAPQCLARELKLTNQSCLSSCLAQTE